MPEPVAAPLAATTVGIVCALATEARQLLRTAAGHGHSPTPAIRRLPEGMLLMVSGIGSEAAATAARALADAGATALMSMGLAGGLDPALRPGTLFLPSAVMPGEPPALLTDPAWRDRLSALLHGLQPVSDGTLFTSPRAIATVGAKAAVFHATAAAAVDMEGFAVAGVALQRQIPFAALKVIVDGAGDALPPCAVAATDATGQVHVGRLLRALLRTPSELGPLVTLARRYRIASRTLAAASQVIARGAHP